MPDTTPISRQPDLPIEDRFLAWIDGFVEPAAATPEPDADFADLAATARIAQRAAGPGSVHLAPDRAETLWEEIMGTTPAATPVQTTLPRSVELPPAGGRSRTVVSPPVGWRGMLPTVVLVAAIIAVAAVTIWRLAGPFDIDFGGDSSGTADQPGVAAPATPATVSTDGCPLTSDMLVFVGETPEGVAELGMIWAQVEPDSDFVIACPGVEHPTPLLTGVTNATSLTWPGTVMLELVGGDAIVFNIGTGGQVNLGPDAAQGRHWVDESSPWLLTPANAAYTDWRITNLKTMASMTLSDEIGGVLAEPMYPEIRWNPTSDHAILKAGPGLGMSGLPGNPENSTVVEMPGGALVVEETLETQRWIDTWGQEAVTEGAIAYQTQIDGQPLIRIEDARSGDEMAEITEVDFNGPPGQRFEFAGAGNMLAYISEGQLWLFDYGAVGARPEQVVIEDRQAIAVYPTGVPGRVLVEMDSDENIGGPGIGGAKMVSILDVSSGEVAAVPGLLPILGLPSSETLDYLVTFAPDADSESRSTAHMTDISSGSVVLSSEPMDASIQTLIEGNNVLAASAMGAVVTVTPPGEDAVLLDANSGMIATISTERLPASEDKGELRWNIAPSFDMKHLFAIGLPQPEGASGLDIANPSDPVRLGDFSIAPLSADPQWSGSLGTIPAGLVPGIPTGQPGDEPTRLEAQEFPSPVSTPATSVAETPGCDLTGDIPIFTGEAPDVVFVETWLLLGDDGNLTLACADTAEVVVTGVARAVPTSWPGAVVLETDSGIVRLLNLVNGTAIDIEVPPRMLDELDTTVGNAGDVEVDLLASPHSPYLISVANDARTDWRVTDLRTMESLLLSDVIPLTPTGPYQPLFISADSNDVAAIRFLSEPMSGSLAGDTGTALPEADLPTANVLLLPGSLAERRWIDVDGLGAIFAEPRSLVVDGLEETFRFPQPPVRVYSDGSLIAYPAVSGDGQAVARVEQTQDGTVVAEVPYDPAAGDYIGLLAGREPSLVLSVGDTIEIVTWSAGVERRQVDGDFGLQTGLYPTLDPDVVLVDAGGGASVINLASAGVEHEFQYVASVRQQLQFVGGRAHIANIVSVAPSGGLSDAPATIQLVDPVSGDMLVESDPIEIHPVQLTGAYPALLARGGDLAVMYLPAADGSGPPAPMAAMVLDASTGESWTIDAPADAPYGWWFIPSSDGRWIRATPLLGPSSEDSSETYFMEARPNAEWIAGGPPLNVVLGTYGMRDTGAVEPAPLEAQGTPSPVAG